MFTCLERMRSPFSKIPLVRTVLAAMLLSFVCAPSALAAGTVSGKITDSVTNAGIPGAQVQFYDLNTNSDFPFVTATADASGNYTQNLPDGSYGLLTQNTLGYINKIWNNVSCSATCDLGSLAPVVVSGSAVTNVNFALVPGGGRISGTVTSSATGNPIAGVVLYFLDSSGEVPFSVATTDASGHYLMEGGSASGNVLVFTRNTLGYQDEVYNNCLLISCTSANPVAVTLGATTSNIDFALDLGGRITGTVRATNNLPLANVPVEVISSTGDKVDVVLTDASGNFVTIGLPAGTYFVNTNNSLGLVDYVWPNLVCASSYCDATQGDPISVTVPNTTGGINFVLPPGQTISGMVTAAAGGAAIQDAFVNVVDASGVSVAGASTGPSGAFTTGALPPGTYFLTAYANSYVIQLYNHLSCPTCPATNGTPVVVANAPVTNIDFSLLGLGTGSITGTVTDGVNLPTGLSMQLVSGTGAVVFAATTNNGVYTFSNVPTGSYYVRTNAPPGGIPFINQLYSGVSCVNACSIFTNTGATPVTVNPGATTSGIDFALQRGGAITGTIIAAVPNVPLSGVGAAVFNSAGVSMGTFTTNASGVYTTTGLPPGTYYVRTTNSNTYINQLWQGQSCPLTACIPTSGTPIVVNGTTVSGIDFALATGGQISGRVTDASTSQGLQNVLVQVFSDAGVGLGSANTDASGNYTTVGLPPGTYYLRTASSVVFQNNQQLAFVDQLYNGTSCVPACLNPTMGTPVTVTSLNTTSNINFALSRGGAIAGVVTDANTGVGLSGVSVFIYTSTGTFAKAAGTSANGGYTVAGLPDGTYFARTNVGGSVYYQDGLYNGLSCAAGCTVTSGMPITVTSNHTRNSVNFALASGAGGISGTVTDGNTGKPLAGISVDIYTASGQLVKSAGSNLAGTYATAGLAPGTYYARTHQNVPTGLSDQLYSGRRCGSCSVTTGTPIVVAAGAMTTGIDFALGTGTLTLTKGDFDADGKTDVAVWRQQTGTWYIVNSSNNSTTTRAWGAGYAPYNDVAVPGDYDGDGKIDIAVWRQQTGTWYIINSSNNSTTTRAWGAGYAPYNDVAVPGDYDGDGKTDIAVWRRQTGTWYIINSSNNSTTTKAWGAGYAPYNDVAVPADYDGDGKTDIAVWRQQTGTWYIINSSNNSTTVGSWGAGYAPYNDVAVPADYDGDGKADIAVWRTQTGTWYIINSSNHTTTTKAWGAGYAPYNDVAVPGDYDGDGKADIAVWRQQTGIWYIVNSSNNSTTAKAWGAGYAPYNDIAIPSSGIR